MRITRRLAAACLSALLASGCQTPPPPASQPASAPAGDPMASVNTLLPEPPGFLEARIDAAPYEIPAWAKHLKGVRICLDPGHGGDAHQRGFKRGPTGVREAEMNLRVSQYLRALLEHVGAEVRLTRDADVDLPLPQRAGVANAWPADVFVSVHHNAVSNAKTNYTTVWHHGTIESRPSSLDLARCLADALYDHFPQPQFTDVPLKSDQLMYPGGFGVLSNCAVTAALTESSFYTQPEEEQRLRDPEYNFKEAYALFIGLARYAHNGLPRATLVDVIADEDARGARDTETAAAAATLDNDAGPRGVRLVFQLDDGLRGRKAWGWERQMIAGDSIAVRVDGRRVEHQFSPDDYRLVVQVPPFEGGKAATTDASNGAPPAAGVRRAIVEVHFQNMNRNSNLNPRFEVEIPE